MRLATAAPPPSGLGRLHARHLAIVQARRRHQGGRTTTTSVTAAAAAAPDAPAPGGGGRSGTTTPTPLRTSLIPETLRAMDLETAEERALRELTATAQGRAKLSREERAARRRSLAAANAPPFDSSLAANNLSPLKRGRATILQLNVGLRCNQACSHCHVESSPLRTEEMSERVAQRCLELLSRAKERGLTTLDLTGGAPELSPQFRPLVRAATSMGVQVIDRCNLTILTEPGQEDLAQFLAENEVRVVASLPCYGEKNVDAQRGRGVFERSIEGLRMLNAVGYGAEGARKDLEVVLAGGNGGQEGAAAAAAAAATNAHPTNGTPAPPPAPAPALRLDLVYNPGGAFLAPPSSSLEPAYRRELREGYGVEFDSLLCLNNLPIKRFADWLARQDGGGAKGKATSGGGGSGGGSGGGTEAYLRLLVDAFNPAAVSGLMCRDTVSVSYDGTLYDCDFNQQLAMAMAATGLGGGGGDDDEDGGAAEGTASSSSSSKRRRALTVFDIEDLSELEGRLVATDAHCYGCTAGQGSGCQGATS
jgi:hypothetical protein